jgi:hypothetical protein
MSQEVQVVARIVMSASSVRLSSSPLPPLFLLSLVVHEQAAGEVGRALSHDRVVRVDLHRCQEARCEGEGKCA